MDAVRRRTGLALLLFFLSGATALVYEVLWFRGFAQLWGSSSLAIAAVMAAFLLGLGVGARSLGVLADRMQRPLLGYAACEAAIGLWALFVPSMLELLRGIYGRLYPALSTRPVLYVAAEVALAALVLGPPCLAMGATLPFLVRQLARPRGGLGAPTSLLYAVNAAGAAFGCSLAGFVLLPSLGLDGTRAAAVATSFAIALLALPLSRDAVALGAHTEQHPLAAAARPSSLALCTAAGAAGFAALVLQMVWVRELAVLLGGSTYAFTSMLTVVLIGIAAGSALLHALLRRVSEPLHLLGPLFLVLSLALAAGQAAIPILTEVVGDLGHLRSSQSFNALLCGLASVVLELVPAACAGLLFPLLVHWAGGAETAGRAVGRVFFWNTLGTTCGAILAYAVLIPGLGTRASLLLALGLYLFAFGLLVGPLSARRRLAARLAAVSLLALALLLYPRFDPRVTERGLYVYGPASRDVLEDAEVLFHAEGSSANVLVTGHGSERVLRVNGKVDASTHAADQVTQLGSAYLPLFLRPSSQRVFVIGYGSGATAGACLQLPGARVTCAEIEREVFRASVHFAAVNHGPELSPAFEIRFEDGRAHLAGTDDVYDLIITEPSNPWLAGVANLFTREFLLTARERLAPEGLLAQWIQTYALSPAEYRRVLRTVADVYPHVALLRLTQGDTVVLASRVPIVPGREELERAERSVAAAPSARADLERYLGGADVRALLLTYCVLGDEELRALAGSPREEGLNTDANLRLEFDAPLRLFDRESESGARIDDLLLGAVRGGWQRTLASALDCRGSCANGLARLHEALRASGNTAGADATLALGLELDPEHPGLLAERMIHGSPAPEELEANLALLLRTSTSDAMRVALAAAREGDAERALFVLDRILETLPGSLTARAHRVTALWQLGRAEEARRELDALVQEDPLHEPVRAAVRLLRTASPGAK